MKSFSAITMVLLVLAALASLAAAQSFGDFFPGFAAAQSSGAAGGRSNTGPILFPNTPPGSETSGVVVGASGFGFVPPGGRTGGARGNSAAFTGSFGSEDYL
ncbi:uncharacterized protein LOC117641585 isoform X2 [Thrips palmi]|uniref:Uncharacterized protein LOC117641585 isoform X2 n=1 Tax=Thrips palmi TaxID=161013 RepID=A0A6P8YER8_THRPL|nr:uncharacterized protein LOC117641585 isoform X2 [Thrips palmi]